MTHTIGTLALEILEERRKNLRETPLYRICVALQEGLEHYERTCKGEKPSREATQLLLHSDRFKPRALSWLMGFVQFDAHRLKSLTEEERSLFAQYLSLRAEMEVSLLQQAIENDADNECYCKKVLQDGELLGVLESLRPLTREEILDQSAKIVMSMDEVV